MTDRRKLSVYITGAHSVGKTTLHEALLKNREFSGFRFKGQEETARAWIRSKGYTQANLRDPVIFLQLEYELLYAQLQREETEISDSDGNFCRFLWDRGLIDPLIYTNVFCEKGVFERMLMIPKVQATLSRLRRNDDTHIFVPRPQKGFIVFDGLRPDSDMDELLMLHNTTIRTLNELAIPYTAIDVGNLNERINIVLNTLKQKWPFLTK